MNIFFAVNHSGCAWWRMRQPFNMIKKKNLANVKIFDNATNDPQELVKNMFEWSDVVVTQSPAGLKAVSLALSFIEMGKTVIVDFDDLTFSCSPFNPAYKTLGLSEVKVKDIHGKESFLWKDETQGFSIKDNELRFKSQQHLLKIAHGITTTTEELKNLYLETVPNRKDDFYILPNSIDFNLFKPLETKDVSDVIRIGWTASDSHLSEFWLVNNVMTRLFKKYGNRICFVLLGNLKQFDKIFENNSYERHDFVALSVYPLKLASLHLDIGICPLENDAFNRGKSQLKWSEYSALRIPSVCSDVIPYNCVENNVTGLKAKNEDEFVERIGELIENKEKRKYIADNAFDKNYSDFNLDKNITRWIDTYEEIVASKWLRGQA